MSDEISLNIQQYFTDEGSFIPARLGEEIKNITRFITMKDTNEIYAYDKGLYRPDGETLIRNQVTETLGESAKKHYGEEVVYYIRTTTYIDREDFAAPLSDLPLQNGIFDLNKAELREYTTHDFFTSKLPIYYNPNAKCEKVEKFLSEIVKPEHIKLLKEIAAYCLYRAYPIQTGFMMIGEGSNGKSVFLSLIKKLIGQENVTAIPIQDLEEKPFAIAQLYQKMANIYPDLSNKALYSTGRFKMLTGGDMVTAEKKFQQPFNFVNYAKMIFSCNQIPIAYDDSNAFHRRWVIVNFPNRFDEKTADIKLLDKLTAEDELSGFFNQLIPILQELVNRGHFSYEMTIEQRRELYKRLSDPVAAFCMDMLEFDSASWIGKKELYGLFCDYCKQKNYAIQAENTFKKGLFRNLNISETHKRIGDKRVHAWIGVKLKENEAQEAQEAQVSANLLLFAEKSDRIIYNKEKGVPPVPPVPNLEHKRPDCLPSNVEEMNPGYFYCYNCGADSKTPKPEATL